MADRLAAALAALPGLRLVQPVEANELFVAMPEPLIGSLRRAGLRVPSLAGAAWRRVARWSVWSRASPLMPEDVDALERRGGRAWPRQGFGIALVDEPREERQRRRLAVLTAPGPSPRRGRDSAIPGRTRSRRDPRRRAAVSSRCSRRQPLVPPQLEAAPHLGRQQSAVLDQVGCRSGRARRCRAASRAASRGLRCRQSEPAAKASRQQRWARDLYRCELRPQCA